MDIILANPRGFCAGVEMAIETVKQTLKIVGAPLYVYHEIVHNRHVVDELCGEGVQFVNSIDEVPEKSTVIFSAHGVSPAIRQQAKDKRLNMIDATCPLVTKVHAEAVRYAKQGYQIILVGHAGHDEVVGTVGEAPEVFHIVESAEDVEALTLGQDEKIAYLTQTTLSMDDALKIISAIKKKYPNIKEPPSDDICYATTNRQKAVRELSRDVQLVLVVGSANSSNSVRLTEISETTGAPAHLVDDVSEIDFKWFENIKTVLVTAGASAPEHLVSEIVEELKGRYGGQIKDSHVVEENMSFNLPVQLRIMQKEKAIA